MSRTLVIIARSLRLVCHLGCRRNNPFIGCRGRCAVRFVGSVHRGPVLSFGGEFQQGRLALDLRRPILAGGVRASGFPALAALLV